jgi:hypothetical protein
MKAGYLRDMDEAPQTEEAKPTRPSYSVDKAVDLPSQALLGNLASVQNCNVTLCFDNCICK